MSPQDLFLFLFYLLAISTTSIIWAKKSRGSYGENGKPHDFSIHCASLAWAVGVLLKSSAMEYLGTKPADEIGHIANGNEFASRMSAGDWSVGEDGMVFGNTAFQYFLGLASYFLDSRNGFASLLIISFFCFYGSLRLVVFSIAQTRFYRPHTVFIFFAMASPSLLFWGISNLKEGIMYWSICMTIVKSMELLGDEDAPGKILSYFSLLLFVSVGCIIRPYIMIIWLVALSYLLFFSRHRLVLVPAFVLFVMAAIFVLEQLSGFDSSTESALAVLDGNHENVVALEGSSIQGPRIFLLSGIIAMFFRPFLWSANGVQQVLSALETWSIALFLVYQLGKGRKFIVRHVVEHQQFTVCVLALVGFFILFTWSGNEGLLVRQRIQAIPALVVICMYLMAGEKILDIDKVPQSPRLVG